VTGEADEMETATGRTAKFQPSRLVKNLDITITRHDIVVTRFSALNLDYLHACWNWSI
jgi:hypothetical protein